MPAMFLQANMNEKSLTDAAINEESENVRNKPVESSDPGNQADDESLFPLPPTDAPVEELIEARRRIIWRKH